MFCHVTCNVVHPRSEYYKSHKKAFCMYTWVYMQGRIQGFRKGGKKRKEVTVHVMVPSTGRRPGVAGGWFGGGCPPCRIRKN